MIVRTNANQNFSNQTSRFAKSKEKDKGDNDTFKKRNSFSIIDRNIRIPIDQNKRRISEKDANSKSEIGKTLKTNELRAKVSNSKEEGRKTENKENPYNKEKEKINENLEKEKTKLVEKELSKSKQKEEEIVEEKVEEIEKELLEMQAYLSSNIKNPNESKDEINIDKEMVSKEEISISQKEEKLLDTILKTDGKIEIKEDDSAKDLSEKELKDLKETLGALELDSKGKINEKSSQENRAKREFENVLSALSGEVKELKVKKEELTESEEISSEKTLEEETKEIKIESKENKETKSDTEKGKTQDIEKPKIQGIKNDSEKLSPNEIKNEEIQNIAKNNIEIADKLKTNIFERVREAINTRITKTDTSSEMTINLRPDELGKVELKIELHKDTIIARFNVSSQIVKEAIEANLSDLKTALKDKGFEFSSFDVDVRKENNSNNFSENTKSQAKKREDYSYDLESEIVNKAQDMYLQSLETIVNSNTTFEYLG